MSFFTLRAIGGIQDRGLKGFQLGVVPEPLEHGFGVCYNTIVYIQVPISP